jgi:hypothetical protein
MKLKDLDTSTLLEVQLIAIKQKIIESNRSRSCINDIPFVEEKLPITRDMVAQAMYNLIKKPNDPRMNKDYQHIQNLEETSKMVIKCFSTNAIVKINSQSMTRYSHS